MTNKNTALAPERSQKGNGPLRPLETGIGGATNPLNFEQRGLQMWKRALRKVRGSAGRFRPRNGTNTTTRGREQ
eukprot:13770292-Alexandrium_andersonii.AAC.1